MYSSICIVSIFIVPLQSSFAKKGTPLNEGTYIIYYLNIIMLYLGLILPRAVGIMYLALVVILPGVIFTALNSTIFFPRSNINSYLV